MILIAANLLFLALAIPGESGMLEPSQALALMLSALLVYLVFIGTKASRCAATMKALASRLGFEFKRMP